MHHTHTNMHHTHINRDMHHIHTHKHTHTDMHHTHTNMHHTHINRDMHHINTHTQTCITHTHTCITHIQMHHKHSLMNTHKNISASVGDSFVKRVMLHSYMSLVNFTCSPLCGQSLAQWNVHWQMAHFDRRPCLSKGLVPGRGVL